MISRLAATSRSWSRSSIPTLARVVLVLAVCVELSLIHHVQSANYTVGAGFVESGSGSTWTNTVNGLLRPEILEDAYQNWASSVNVTVGDTLVFEYPRGTHTVFLASNKTAFTSCDFNGAVQIPDGVPTTGSNCMFPLFLSWYTIKKTDSTLYFVCTIPGHCTGGQKVEITPLGTTPLPSLPPSPPTSNAPWQSSLNVGTVVMLLFVCLFI